MGRAYRRPSRSRSGATLRSVRDGSRRQPAPAQNFGAGGLLAISHGQDRTEWRRIRSRDDPLRDEVACNEVTSQQN